MRRYELSDAGWNLISGLLPAQATGRQGRPWHDHRAVLNGIFWVLCSGAAWRDVPERYGPWSTIHTRFRRWREDGTFDWILRHLQIELDSRGLIDYATWTADSTSVRASKAAAGARKRGIQTKQPTTRSGAPEAAPAPEIHLVCDAGGLPLAAHLSAGQRHDSSQFEPLMTQVCVHTAKPGRSRTRPGRLVADRGYDAKRIRRYLRRRGIGAMIPERRPAKGRKRRRRGGRRSLTRGSMTRGSMHSAT